MRNGKKNAEAMDRNIYCGDLIFIIKSEVKSEL